MEIKLTLLQGKMLRTFQGGGDEIRGIVCFIRELFNETIIIRQIFPAKIFAAWRFV